MGEYNRTTKNFEKNYPDKVFYVEEALLNYISDNDLKFLKTEFPDSWKCLSEKLAYPYEYSNIIDDYQKPVNN